MGKRLRRGFWGQLGCEAEKERSSGVNFKLERLFRTFPRIFDQPGMYGYEIAQKTRSKESTLDYY